MYSLITIIVFLSTAARFTSAYSRGTNSRTLQARQRGNFVVQDWENDYAIVDFINGPTGQFSVEWNKGFGGDFVVGKGYSSRVGSEL